MRQARAAVAVAVAAIMVAAGVGAYWEWSQLSRHPASSGCPTHSEGVGPTPLGAPPLIFLLSPSASWTWWHSAGGFTYNVTLNYAISTASTSWTGFELDDESFHHSPIGYTVTLRNVTVGEVAIFNSSHSSWRVDSGQAPSENLTNWTPTSGTPIRATEVFQFQSESNLTAAGLEFTLAMMAGPCGPSQAQPIAL
jgi:hypothetical protein